MNHSGAYTLFTPGMMPEPISRGDVSRPARSDTERGPAEAAHGDDNSICEEGRRIDQWIESRARPEFPSRAGVECANTIRERHEQLIAVSHVTDERIAP